MNYSIKNTLGVVLSFVFPEKCLSCARVGTPWCLGCISKTRVAERECAEWIYPLYDYRDSMVKKAVWLLKYKNKRSVADTMAELMSGKIKEDLSELEILENFYNPVIIPVPLSKERLRERGYNQSAVLAEKICEYLNSEQINISPTMYKRTQILFLKNVLIKTKDTLHQARIKERAERLKNIVDSFSVINAEKIKGRNIILIDDVTTTGGTLKEARKILKKAGAKKILAFTFAH